MHRAHMVALAVAASAGAASGQVFFDAAAWEAAAAGPVVAPDYAAIAPVDFAIGANNFAGLFDVTVETNGGPFSGSDANFNGVQNFIFDFDPVTRVTITFNQAITGFSALWSNTFVEDGFSVSTDSNTYDLNDLSDPLNASFIGVHENAGFTSITLTTTDPNPGNDFVFFRELNWVPVPAPGVMAVFASAGLLAARRRR